MQFTPPEAKLIEKLRKEQRRWPYTRWVVLAVGVLSTFTSSLMGYAVYKLTFDSSQDSLEAGDVFFIVLFWTKCCMWFLIGAWSFITARTKWHGDVNRMLLLRLLDAQAKPAVIGEQLPVKRE